MTRSIKLTGTCRLLMIQFLPTLISSSRVQYSTTVPAPIEMLGRRGEERREGEKRKTGEEREEERE